MTLGVSRESLFDDSEVNVWVLYGGTLGFESYRCLDNGIEQWLASSEGEHAFGLLYAAWAKWAEEYVQPDWADGLLKWIQTLRFPIAEGIPEGLVGRIVPIMPARIKKLMGKFFYNQDQVPLPEQMMPAPEPRLVVWEDQTIKITGNYLGQSPQFEVKQFGKSLSIIPACREVWDMHTLAWKEWISLYVTDEAARYALTKFIRSLGELACSGQSKSIIPGMPVHVLHGAAEHYLNLQRTMAESPLYSEPHSMEEIPRT